MRKLSRIIPILLSILVLVSSFAAGPAPQQPNVTFTLVQGLPATMQIGESYTVVVQVTSDVPFNYAALLPTAYYPGRYVVFGPGDHSGAGTSATLQLTFTAKDSTSRPPNGPSSEIPNGQAPVSVVAGARFQGGYTASQHFDFLVTVP